MSKSVKLTKAQRAKVLDAIETLEFGHDLVLQLRDHIDSAQFTRFLGYFRTSENNLREMFGAPYPCCAGHR